MVAGSSSVMITAATTGAMDSGSSIGADGSSMGCVSSSVGATGSGNCSNDSSLPIGVSEGNETYIFSFFLIFLGLEVSSIYTLGSASSEVSGAPRLLKTIVSVDVTTSSAFSSEKFCDAWTYAVGSSSSIC